MRGTAIPLRHLADVLVSNVDKKVVEGERPVRLVNYTDVYYQDRIGPHLDLMAATANAEQAERFTLRVGDSIITKDSETATDIAVSAYVAETAPDMICGYHLAVIRPHATVNGRFMAWALRSDFVRGQYSAAANGMTRFGLTYDAIQSAVVPAPPMAEQQRIAGFLDDQVTRIDNIITARESQVDLLKEDRAHAAWHALTGAECPDRKASGLVWLGSIPSAWSMVTVHAGYSVMLGKMLDESRFTGRHAMPYLRNTNVQWDRVDIEDLKVMDIGPEERERFTVRAGDLLICEGGQPGRSAIWDGSIVEIGYQKALHRARPRGANDVRWLQAFLRVAVQMSVFAVEFGQATIGHLTGEQLRSLRLPMPPPDVQRNRSDELDQELRRLDAVHCMLEQSVTRFEELKRSLITAAVTGEFDVSSADGSRVPA